jgi:hypothetical protein
VDDALGGVVSRVKIELSTWLSRGPSAASNDNSPVLPRPDPRSGGRTDYLILAAVIVGVALFYWLAILFVDWDRVQTCVTMGLRTCNPTIELNGQ